jgi:glyceraldehyde-3-phosphate dehydrogenase/erythrose-4-phosphate dehydrogenase
MTATVAWPVFEAALVGRELVADFRGDSRSSIIDSSMTMVIGGTLIKVLAWYHNEWGFSCRVGDLTGLVAAKLPVGARA